MANLRPPHGAGHAECRAVLGHAWMTDQEETESYGATVLHSAYCARCGAERRRLLNRHGAVLWTKRRYPKGYLLRGERADRERLRSWWITHLGKEVKTKP